MLQRDSSPWPPRYRCDALLIDLWSHTLGARSIYWVHISSEEWNDVKYIWNNSHLTNCDDHFSLSSTTAVQIWIISYILHIMYSSSLAYVVQTVPHVSVLFFVFEFPAFSLNCCSSFASQSTNKSANVLKLETITFSTVTMKTGCKFYMYFKFGINTIGHSQSFFSQ